MQDHGFTMSDADRIFDAHRELCDFTDAIHVEIAASLLSLEAVRAVFHFCDKLDSGDMEIRLGIDVDDDYTAWYLTRRGYHLAVTYYNAMRWRDCVRD